MRHNTVFARLTPLLAGLGLAGCDAPAETTGPEPRAGPAFDSAPGVVAIVSGGGHFDAGVPVQFSFSAVQRNAAGDGTGRFHFAAVSGGLLVEFHGQVTCVTSDLVSRRAWIGGEITQNNSEHPAFLQEIHQVGRDIWFRVVDYGQGANASQPDRTTFTGFEGGGGIETSLEYCEVRIWPDNDERTGPLLDGNINVIG